MNKTEGMKFDSEKIRMDLLPFDALEEVAKVLTFGAKKYADNNWKHVNHPIIRYEAAMLRHLTAVKKGELLDQDSGLSHRAHLACNALFLLWFEIKEEEFKKTREGDKDEKIYGVIDARCDDIDGRSSAV